MNTMNTMMTPCRRPQALLLALMMTLGAHSAAQADDAAPRKWELPGIAGDQSKWEPGEENWTWDKGNPWTVDGATWTVALQPSPEPGLTDEFKPMGDGLLYNFVRGWVDASASFDPPQYYKGRTLATMSSGLDTGKFPENSKSSAILFKPSTPGTYRVEIAGTAGVQMKSAGYVSVCIYKLQGNRSTASLVDRQLVGDTDGLDAHPTKLAFDQKVDFADGDELVVRIQTISPGQAPAGHGSITFDKFTVTESHK